MYFLYSFIYSLGFLALSPLFLLRRDKYSAGFSERMGSYPEFEHDERRVIWIHCVSVGETNAARPLVDQIVDNFPGHRLIFSTTTRTGQDLAKSIFKDKADAVFYFPFDWKFTVRRALDRFRPSLVLMMETEIWPRFFSEIHSSGAKLAIVNGRISERSFRRYSYVKTFVSRVLSFLDLALMQDEKSFEYITSLGLDRESVKVTGNLKFDHANSDDELELAAIFRQRFGISSDKPLIVAASTHEPEEQWLIESLEGMLGRDVRLLIAPRHPERFAKVAKLLASTSYRVVNRSDRPSGKDLTADIILLDSIGELRAAYPLAEIVFVGGSLIPHGGQSILEPAAVGKAIVTGPHTSNFESVIKEFLARDAIIQTAEETENLRISAGLNEAFTLLLSNRDRGRELGENAALLMCAGDRGATAKTIEFLRPLILE